MDELGYLALDQQTSNLFYQVISTRHSRKRSSIITTNTPFSDWGNILYNTTIAAAIADRLVENSEIFLLGGESLRKAQTCSTSAPIICSCSRGRSTGRVRCCCLWTATHSVFIACMTSPKPTTSRLARPSAWRVPRTRDQQRR